MIGRTMSSREPVLADLDLPTTFSAACFSARYAGESALITGPDGAPIERVSIETIYERWWLQPKAGAAAASVGHVVHWALKWRCSDDLLTPVLREAEKVISTLGREVACALDEFRREETPLYLWAILGPAGSRVRTHRDMFGTASWNVLLSGHKHWTLWAPHRYPEDDAPCLRFEQKPGQIVWVPEDWWHCVTYKEPSLCLSKNLVLRRSLAAVRERIGETEPALARHLAAVAALDRHEIETHAVD